MDDARRYLSPCLLFYVILSLQDNGDVETLTSAVPAIRFDKRTGKKTFFNSMVAAYTGWIDSRNDPTKAVELANGEPVDGNALLHTAKFMESERVAFKWLKGDMIYIDNSLVMHSRLPFERPRRILASIGRDTAGVTRVQSSRL